MPDISSTLTIEEFSRKLRARELTALELTDACLRRIEELRRVKGIEPEMALGEAEEAEAPALESPCAKEDEG